MDKNAIFKGRVEKTIGWLTNTMLFDNSGAEAYFSAIDADSEGAEGSYYVWDYNHIVESLKGGGEIFAKQYGVEKYDLTTLKIRMDEIPVSLAIAQAAK